MDPRVEEILMARAMQDAQDKPSLGEAALGGAAIGAASGAILSSVPISVGRGLNSVQDQIMKGMGKKPPERKGQFMKNAKTRLAGGFVGAALGGALGAGIRNVAVQTSPAAAILAKAQAQGELDYADQLALQRVLTDTYNEMGIG